VKTSFESPEIGSLIEKLHEAVKESKEKKINRITSNDPR